MTRRALLITGVAACLAAYGGVYFASTTPLRALQNEPAPELAWLKNEFNLGDPEFKRICELHAAYLPKCREMCLKIDAKNAELRRLLENSTNVTADVQGALADAARLRAQCQAQMLDHFFEVSRTMPAGQGQRYLAWVRSKALQGNSAMEHGAADRSAHTGHGNH